MKISWAAIAAIGQCAGAVATFFVAFLALKQNRPKIKISTQINDIILASSKPGESKKVDENRLYIKAVNIGNIPVKIKSMGFKLPKGYLYVIPENNTLPKMLMPCEEVDVWVKVNNIEDKKVIEYKCACAYDSAGRTYYCKASLREKIKRFRWWHSKRKTD